MVTITSGPRVWRIVVLVLLVVDVVLVAVILGTRSGSSTVVTTVVTRVTQLSSVSPAAASPFGSPSPTPSSTSPTSPSPSPSPSPSAAPSPAPGPGVSSAAPVQRLLVAVDDRQAWLVTTGTCADGGATVSRTSDGGRSWEPRTAPLNSIGRLVVRLGSPAVFAVGADGGCNAQLRRTADSGATWADANGLDGFFYADPRDPGAVAVPGSRHGPGV